MLRTDNNKVTRVDLFVSFVVNMSRLARLARRISPVAFRLAGCPSSSNQAMRLFSARSWAAISALTVASSSA